MEKLPGGFLWKGPDAAYLVIATLLLGRELLIFELYSFGSHGSRSGSG